jgi:segregation and condensation protein B
MERDALTAVLEAILVTAGRPVTPAAVAESLTVEGVDEATVAAAFEELAARRTDPSSGFRLERAGGGWRPVTPAELAPHLVAFHGAAAKQRLSQAALEVLAIVAYRQPITIPEINFLRGASSSGVVRTLLDRQLIRTAGKKRVVGKPFLYRTSKEFLVHFGLATLADLPEPEEVVAEADPTVGE